MKQPTENQKIEAIISEIPDKYKENIIGYYETRNKKIRFYKDEKTFNEFNISLDEFKTNILKVNKSDISNKGYKILYSRHTVTNEHDLLQSQYTSNICFRETIYYNGKDRNGSPRYYWGWSLNTNDLDVHHIDKNKLNNLSGNLEKLNRYIHEFEHDLEMFVDKGKITMKYKDNLIQSIKHKNLSLSEAKQQLKEKLIVGN